MFLEIKMLDDKKKVFGTKKKQGKIGYFRIIVMMNNDDDNDDAKR